VLATQFGYLPGFLWIVIGAVVAGGVHDFIILVASTRRNGRSLFQIAKDEVGPLAGVATAIAILFIIIIAIAGLGMAVINALFHNPWGTFTVIMTVPIALFMGWYLYKLRPGKVGEVSAIGVVLLVLSLLVGQSIAGSALEPYFNLERHTLILLMAGYAFFASTLPIWMLLAPRDYLSSFLKISTVLLLGAGVIALAPTIQMPRTTEFIHGGGPIIPGMVFPFVFITIACGALSGFHSLISSGTTPKMIQRESEMKMIGFGAMLMEGFVGVMAIIAAAVLIPGDYFVINTNLTPETLAAMGFPVTHIRELSSMVGLDVSGRPGGAVSLAVGMAYIFSSLPGMKGLMAYWYQFALLFEAVFILTTIDAGTRVARYILQESGGYLVPRLKQRDWMPGIVLTSGIVVLTWTYFLMTGSVSSIWPMFGVSNQLLGVIALGVGTTVLIKMKKTQYLWVTLAPMAFMAVTTLVASYQLFWIFVDKAKNNPAEALVNNLDATLVAVAAGLTILIVLDCFHKWYGYLVQKKPAISTEVALQEASSFPVDPSC
jgi:carbon starvation protein